jgi:hypothetical protein
VSNHFITITADCKSEIENTYNVENISLSIHNFFSPKPPKLVDGKAVHSFSLFEHRQLN